MQPVPGARQCEIIEVARASVAHMGSAQEQKQVRTSTAEIPVSAAVGRRPQGQDLEWLKPAPLRLRNCRWRPSGAGVGSRTTALPSPQFIPESTKATAPISICSARQRTPVATAHMLSRFLHRLQSLWLRDSLALT